MKVRKTKQQQKWRHKPATKMWHLMSVATCQRRYSAGAINCSADATELLGGKLHLPASNSIAPAL